MDQILDTLKEKIRMSFIDKLLKDKKTPVIKSYDGGSTTYSSNDEDYAEFLQNLNIINDNEPASVEDTMSFNIRRKEVEDEQTPTEPQRENDEDSNVDTMPKMYMSLTDDKLLSISSSVERLTNIVENNDIRKEHTLDKVLAELSNISSEIAEIKISQEKMQNSISDLAKVSDSVFDLKNAQQGMRTSMHNMEAGVTNLKKKIVSAMTLLSVLSFLVVIMQILNLFS